MRPSVRKEGFSKNSRNDSTSRSHPVLGRSGMRWATTLKPASLARRKQVPTAATVWPRLVSRATSSYVDCSPSSSRVQPYDSMAVKCGVRQ